MSMAYRILEILKKKSTILFLLLGRGLLSKIQGIYITFLVGVLSLRRRLIFVSELLRRAKLLEAEPISYSAQLFAGDSLKLMLASRCQDVLAFLAHILLHGVQSSNTKSEYDHCC